MDQRFFVTTPDLPKIGETNRAYLQRAVVIIVALVCVGFDAHNLKHDCNLVKFNFAANENAGNGLITNTTGAAAEILTILGADLDGGSDFFFDDEFLAKQSAMVFGVRSFGFVDLDNQQSSCVSYWDAYEANALTTSEKSVRYFAWMKRMARLAPVLGVIGVLCASMEFFLCVFYPSVVLGSVLLGGAAVAESVMLLMFIVEFLDAFSRKEVELGRDFWESLIVMMGYFFSSCLLLFGLRTYPWCWRKNRDPANCKVVDAEIVDEYGEQIDSETPRSLSRSSSEQESDSNREFVSIEVHRRLQKELIETKRKLSGRVKFSPPHEPDSKGSLGDVVPIETHRKLEEELSDTMRKLSESLKKLEEANAVTRANNTAEKIQVKADETVVPEVNVGETKTKLSRSLKELRETIVEKKKTGDDAEVIALANEVVDTVFDLLKWT